MKVSVALASFRGGAFIAEQLSSIALQSKPPEEIVVFDDASDDATMEIVNDFANRSEVSVISYGQHRNVGVIGNFESAIAATKGDIVFLSDQDDVWYPEKIEKFTKVFATQPEIGLVFCNANLVDRNLKPLGRTLWQSIRFTQSERNLVRSARAFELLLRRFLVTGAALAFRRDLLEVILPISNHLIHDAWIALVVAAVSRIECIDEPLMQYRQHAGQQIGERANWRNWKTQIQAAKGMSANYFHQQRGFFHDLSLRLDDQKCSLTCDNCVELVKQKIKHLESRIEWRESSARPLLAIAHEYVQGRYSRYSYGWKSAAQDMFL